MSAASGTRAIVAALAANLGIAVTKFIAFAADRRRRRCWPSRSTRWPTPATRRCCCSAAGGPGGRRRPEHPFGYGRERYIYAFIVSIVLFSVGGLFALYEGYHKLIDPHRIDSVAVGADRRAGGRDRAGVVLVPDRDPGVATRSAARRPGSSSSATPGCPSCRWCCWRTWPRCSVWSSRCSASA